MFVFHGWMDVKMIERKLLELSGNFAVANCFKVCIRCHELLRVYIVCWRVLCGVILKISMEVDKERISNFFCRLQHFCEKFFRLF